MTQPQPQQPAWQQPAYVPVPVPPPTVPAFPSKTVRREKVRTNHTFHLLMSLVTLGLWIPVWAFVALANAIHPGRRVVERHY